MQGYKQGDNRLPEDEPSGSERVEDTVKIKILVNKRSNKED